MAEAQNGRIGGGVLQDNLLREGLVSGDPDLRFYQSNNLTPVGNPLLHLDIVNKKIGVNLDGPSDALQVPNAVGSTNLKSTVANIANYTIENNSITNILDSDIELFTTDLLGSISATSIATDNLNFDNNSLISTTADTNIELRPDASFVSLLRTLDNPSAYDTSDGDRFGESVAIDGNYVIVGAWFEDDAGGTQSGKAYIFDVTSGTLVQTLDNPNDFDTSQSDFFGVSVAISGNYAIVGAYYENDAGGNESGKAYIFNINTGALVHTLDNPNAYSTSDDDRFGESVAIDGNYAIVSARYEDDADGINSGKAYIFDVISGNLLHTLDNPNAFGTSQSDRFGRSVSISGNYAIVGAWGEDEVGGVSSSGKAYIFNVGTGALVHTLDNPNAYGNAAGDNFGWAVAISGNNAIVSAYQETDAGGSYSGKAYIFNVGTGALVHTLDNPNAYGISDSDYFGNSVAIDGNYAIVGASRESDAGGSFSGKAYVFNVTTGELLSTLDNPNSYGTSAGDFFGVSVAISGNYAIVGTPSEDDADGSFSGKAYVFNADQRFGTVEINSDLNVTGAIHATGDITLDANLTLGNDDRDSVTFEADVNSDIIPDQSDTFSLGTPTKKWGSIYSDLLNGQRVDVGSVTVSDTSLALRQGNTFYVSTLGDDTNVGDHQHGAFRTLKHALDFSDASFQGPVTIHIFPGEYEEEFPLVVPPHVTIHGEDIRNVIVKPTVATQDKDAFLVEGDVTIENMTIKDYYYNSTTNTGHAFRFKPNGLVSTRSPYIRNITVITKGSITSASDPRGFDTGDAGKGALINGNEIDGDSLEASMLFHSCTFITPGVDCITMTNGVRVEWLNSFTYFANRGLYATQGAEGKIMPDSSIRYGAEIRSIGSANVYGNYGAVADGANTLMYLISHNFSYIGTGKDVTNDSTLVIQNNEVVEINFGKIYFNSTDAAGTYRIGDAFFADFETGSTSIDATAIDFTGVSSIIVNTGGELTYIDGERIDTGNIRISGNTIENIAEDLIIDPHTEILQLSSNPALIVSRGADLNRVEKTAGIRYNTDNNIYEGYADTGHLSLGGIYSDDFRTSIDTTDTTNKIIIRVDNVEVGELNDTVLELHGLSTNDILFDSNILRATSSDSELELRRNGNGALQVYDIDFNRSTTINWEAVAREILRTAARIVVPLTDFLLSAAPDGYLYGDINLQIFGATPGVIPFGSPSPVTSFDSGLIYDYAANGTTGNATWDTRLETVFIPELLSLRASDPATYNQYFISPTSIITNTSNNSLVVTTTDRGYVKFEGSTGLVIPSGTTAERPAGVEVGYSRWNTDDEILETWNGTNWQRSAGEGEEVTDIVLKELTDIYTLVLG